MGTATSYIHLLVFLSDSTLALKNNKLSDTLITVISHKYSQKGTSKLKREPAIQDGGRVFVFNSDRSTDFQTYAFVSSISKVY